MSGVVPLRKDDPPGWDFRGYYVAAPSVQEGLTSLFGMGTGASPPVWSPESFDSACHYKQQSCTVHPACLAARVPIKGIR